MAAQLPRSCRSPAKFRAGINRTATLTAQTLISVFTVSSLNEPSSPAAAQSAVSLADFRDTAVPVHDRPRPDRLVTGNPDRTTWTHYSAAHGDFDCGIWACEPGAWRIAFPAGKEEFFAVISGRLRITSQAGEAREFGPGDACVIPAGFTGVFEVIETVRKHFVVIDRNAG